MKRKKRSVFMISIALFLLHPAALFASDLLLEGNLAGGTYDSSGRIIAQNSCTINTGVAVTALSTYETILGPGTSVKAGGSLVIRPKDQDGLSNYCEVEYFNSLSYGPGDDPDGDGLSNQIECASGTHPYFNESNPDRDGDGLHDLWELTYWVGDLSHGAEEDTDGDGLTNYQEFRFESNPSEAFSNPVIYYEYDELGRIRKIYRLPGQ